MIVFLIKKNLLISLWIIIIILLNNSFIKSLYIDVQKRVKSKKKTKMVQDTFMLIKVYLLRCISWPTVCGFTNIITFNWRCFPHESSICKLTKHKEKFTSSMVKTLLLGLKVDELAIYPCFASVPKPMLTRATQF